MARVIFFSEQLPPSRDPIAGFSFELMRSLADQHHDVLVLTTYRTEADQLPSPHPKIEIVRPFRKWNWLEMTRVLPILLAFRPDILHVIQPRTEALSGWTNAMSTLPAVKALLGNPALITSFYDLRDDTFLNHRLLLIGSDALTFTHQSHLEHVESELRKRFQRQILMAIAPPPYDQLGMQEASVELNRSTCSEFFTSHRRVIFLPGELAVHRELPKLFGVMAEILTRFPETGLLIGGGWGDISSLRRRQLMQIFEDQSVGARVLLTGPQTDFQERYCLQRAHLVFAASLPAESLLLTRVLRAALSSSAVLVLDREQVERDPLPWRHGEHAFVSDDWARTLVEALSAEDFKPAMQKLLREFARHEVQDQPANVVSRLYTRLMDRT